MRVVSAAGGGVGASPEALQCHRKCRRRDLRAWRHIRRARGLDARDTGLDKPRAVLQLVNVTNKLHLCGVVQLQAALLVPHHWCGLREAHAGQRTQQRVALRAARA